MLYQKHFLPALVVGTMKWRAAAQKLMLHLVCLLCTKKQSVKPTTVSWWINFFPHMLTSCRLAITITCCFFEDTVGFCTNYSMSITFRGSWEILLCLDRARQTVFCFIFTTQAWEYIQFLERNWIEMYFPACPAITFNCSCIFIPHPSSHTDCIKIKSYFLCLFKEQTPDVRCIKSLNSQKLMCSEFSHWKHCSHFTLYFTSFSIHKQKSSHINLAYD